RGWDSNPRRPTPIGPEPIPFDRSGTPAINNYFLIFESDHLFVLPIEKIKVKYKTRLNTEKS
ncbi:MAG: hypothetical protein ACXVHM_07375, partial [Methanobacterium sp.]